MDTNTPYIAHMPDENGIIKYVEEEHKIWSILYDRQIKLIENRASQTHLEGLKKLNLKRDHIPQPIDVSNALQEITGWAVKPVAALIDFNYFFELLANKHFPAASFIRTMNDLDYLKEPDIFHEIFGHCPILTEPHFAEFVYEVGKLGITLNKEDQIMLGRLFWFTVEFGLIFENNNLRIYGAGILSSKSESIYALESPLPVRKPLNILEALRTPYRYDEIQRVYFTINSYEELYNLVNGKLVQTFAKARELGMLPLSQIPITNDDYRSC